MLKFGISGDISRRELKEHRKTFIKFNILHIESVEANAAVESKLKIEWSARNMIRSLLINKCKQTELITITSNNGIETCVQLKISMKLII